MNKQSASIEIVVKPAPYFNSFQSKITFCFKQDSCFFGQLRFYAVDRKQYLMRGVNKHLVITIIIRLYEFGKLYRFQYLRGFEN